MASIVASDLVAYASQYFPGLGDDYDTAPSGGNIDKKMRIIFTDIVSGSPDYVKVAVTNPAQDAGNLTVYGRSTDGTKVSQTLALNTTPVGGYVVFNSFTGGVTSLERILAVVYEETNPSTVLNNSVQVLTGAGVTIGTIPAGEKGFTRLFINAYSDVTDDKYYYMKFYWCNTNQTNTLINATIKEANESTTGLMSHAVSNSVGLLGDSFTLTKRRWGKTENPVNSNGDFLSTAITASGFVNTGELAVPNNNLPKEQAVGVWLRFQLDHGVAPIRGTYTSQIFGLST